MHLPAVAAAPLVLASVERLEERRQVGDDALQLHLGPMDELPAAAGLVAVPLETVRHARGTLALDDEADAALLGPLRRMAHMRREQEDGALPERNRLAPAVDPEIQEGVAAHLEEELL